MAKFIRSENVEVMEVERKEVSKEALAAPPSPTPKVQMPSGEYVPVVPLGVDVNVQYVEVAFEAEKIDVDNVQWSPSVMLKGPVSNESSSEEQSPDPSRRKAIRVIKPEIPLNMGIQEPRIEVVLRVVISESGFVAQAEIERSGGYQELDIRALGAVRQWIYESAPRKETRLVKVEYVF